MAAGMLPNTLTSWKQTREIMKVIWWCFL